MHLLLLRHGQTDENARGILQGQSQTELNDQGREQALLLARRLRTWTPPAEVLVTSDLARARQTADAVAAELGLVCQERPTWRERSFGPYEGRTIGEADIWRAASGHWDLPGAEPTVDFLSRIEAALGAITRDFAARHCVAVVTHGAVLRNVLNLLRDGRLVLADGAAPPASVPIINCAVMHLEVRWNDESVASWRVHCVNNVDHLPAAVSPVFRVEE
jgi:broad specificity phosphatase PhoE